MADTEQVVKTGETPRALQWSLAAGFVAWGADLGFSYVLAQHSCSTGHYYVLRTITWVCFVIALSGLVAGMGIYRKVQHDAIEEGRSPHDRAYFQALMGMAFSVAFAVVIVAAAVPHWILSPCE